jgi:hypothetical protein
MAITLTAGSTPDTSFSINGLEYQRGGYTPIYDIQKNTDGTINSESLKIGLRSINTNEQLVSPTLLSGWKNGSGTAYTTLASLLEDITSLVFRSALGGSGALKTGFIDYNDTTGEIPLTANTWTDVPNNGLGSFSKKRL